MPKKQAAPPPPESLLPIAPATFDILLALAGGENHGYGIMKEVATRTDGAVQIGAGTLYGALKRLLASGVVEEIERDDPDDPSGRRRYYRLTRYGLDVARAESRRLQKAVQDAHQKKLIPRRVG
ncbi:MAG TPA: PadR family transcriptional regulator [Gemmatimonadaceae bacterium]|jgi:DNA-binding PadR family transcriptional regulator